MLRIAVRNGLIIGVIAICNSLLWSDDVNHNEKDTIVDLSLEEANNRLPMPLNEYNDQMERNEWRLISPIPKNCSRLTLSSPHDKKDAQLVFLWSVIPDGKLQFFGSGVMRYRFDLVDSKPFLKETFALRDGRSESLVLWEEPPVIKSPGSFTISGTVKVKGQERKIVKLLNETVSKVEHGRVIRTWFTSRITTVEFLKKSK